MYGKIVKAISALAVIGFLSISMSQQAIANDSLYKRLGGYDAIAAVVDDFLGRMIKDKKLGRFFSSMSDDGKTRARQLTVDFICEAAGGPCAYNGRTMPVSHKGMGISEEDWKSAAGHLVATLKKFKVPEKETKDVLAFVTSLKDGIVDKS